MTTPTWQKAAPLRVPWEPQRSRSQRWTSGGRHDPQTVGNVGGSNYLLADGHVKFLRCQNVSGNWGPVSNNGLPAPLVATANLQ